MDDLFLYQDKWCEILDKYYINGIEALSPVEKVWFYCEDFFIAMNDGGISSYFYNHAGENYKEALEGLGIIGATKTKELLLRVGNLFPNGNPSKDITQRNDIISLWDEREEIIINEVDKKYREQDEKPEDNLVKYLQDNNIFPEK